MRLRSKTEFWARWITARFYFTVKKEKANWEQDQAEESATAGAAKYHSDANYGEICTQGLCNILTPISF